jgi:hypothetical protein
MASDALQSSEFSSRDLLQPVAFSSLELLPDLVISIPSEHKIVFDKNDEIQPEQNIGESVDAKTRAALQASAHKRAQFCKGRPWWNCTQQNTQGACLFKEGQCRAAPVNANEESYFTKWLRIYGPIYNDMPQPKIDVQGNLVPVTPATMTLPAGRPRRKKSIQRPIPTYV